MKNKDVMRKLLTMPQADAYHSEFRFEVYHCGTQGCLAGDIPGVSPEWDFYEDAPVLKTYTDTTRSLEDFFNLPTKILQQIFYVGPGGVNPPREKVQAHGIKILKENGIDIFED